MFYRLLLLFIFLLITSCGGGGGDALSISTNNSLTVVPALGGVSAGVNVAIYDSNSGAQIGSGVTNLVNGLGTATVNLTSNFSGIAIVKVYGCSTCTYLDERTFSTVSFADTDSLLAVTPVSTSGQSIGVSTLTNMAAAALSVTANNFNGSALTLPTTHITTSSVNSSVASVLSIFGLSSDSTSNNLLLFSVPVIYGINSQSTDQLSGSGSSLNLGVLLTALAQSIPSGTSLTSASTNLSSATAQSVQNPQMDLKAQISSLNLITNLPSKLTTVIQNNLSTNSTIDANLSSSVSLAIQASTSSGSTSSGSLVASTPSKTIAIGLSTQIQLSLKAPNDLNTVVTPSSATYSSDNTNVLTVTKSGLVNSMGPGTANITITYQNLSTSISITVPNGVNPNGFSGQVFN